MKQIENRLCGLAAVRARFSRDASSILRLYFDLPTSRKVGDMCSALAAAKKIYRCVEPAELEKLADTVHHGGIVAVVRDEPPKVPTGDDLAAWARARANLVVLDRVGNAHNLGAIARTAAYFGIPRIILSGDMTAARAGSAAYRVAEGGMDALEVWIVPLIAPFLRTLAAGGYEVIGAATRGGVRTGMGRARSPWALVLGSEEAGMAPSVEAACTRLVTIPGCGKIESLNVSAAAAVLLNDLVGAGKK